MITAVTAARTLPRLAARPLAPLRQRCSRTMAAAPRATPAFQLLQYDYVPDILEKRGPHREGHLAAAEALRSQGKCMLGGAFGDPVEGGLFVLKGMSKEEIEAYVKDDPYVIAGLVTNWRILPYMVAVGGDA